MLTALRTTVPAAAQEGDIVLVTPDGTTHRSKDYGWDSRDDVVRAS